MVTHINLTLSEDTLHHLISGDDQGISMLLKEALNQILEHQRTEQIEAAPYERTDSRQGLRNGYKPRKLNTRVGTLNLRVPQVREGVFSTELFKRYQRSEQALVLALMEMVVNGVSTRKVSRITEELCGTEFSASTVSGLCKQLDPIVSGWKSRPLGGQAFPFVLVDALIVKIRENGRVQPHSALLAVGINSEGHREILGFEIGDSESEDSWKEFFTSLKHRGLSGVDLLVSDDHRGLVNAIQTCFQGVTWQRCQTHFTKNILDKCPKSLQSELKSRLRPVFEASDTKTARLLAKGIQEQYAIKAGRAVETLDRGLEDAIAVLTLPEYYRRRLRTTNSVERLNQEVRRRERVIRIFPNPESATRLIGAVLMEKHEEWSEGRSYFDMAEYWTWKREKGSASLKKNRAFA